MLKMIASRLTRLVLTVLVVTFVTFTLTNVGQPVANKDKH